MVVPVDKERVRLALGEEIERTGRVSETSIAAAAKAVRKLSSIARRAGVASLDVFLTAPGRQSENSGELVAALRRAAKHPVRVLSTEEEGRLAYGGAVATADLELPDRIAVCDVGGASTEIAVGAPGRPPEWVASVDLGSVRLTARAETLDDARREAAFALADVEPPKVGLALTVGGSARATRRLVGPWLGEVELAEALRLLETKPPRHHARLRRRSRPRSHPACGRRHPRPGAGAARRPAPRLQRRHPRGRCARDRCREGGVGANVAFRNPPEVVPAAGGRHRHRVKMSALATRLEAGCSRRRRSRDATTATCLKAGCGGRWPAPSRSENKRSRNQARGGLQSSTPFARCYDCNLPEGRLRRPVAATVTG
jgi:Ppx/GppA phosphatase family protein